uniref:NADH-ubiquinone oxidoreductase chain 2 n=1 Tax=Lingula anatina TaxID=7574 RepID=A0A0R7JKZ3_LINAN|nr:NADH dehydrogenase subunit 2 [Lingula anatina]
MFSLNTIHTYFFFFLMSVGSLMSASCGDLIVGWVGMEVMLLCFFPIVIKHNKPWLSVLGCINYFIIQVVSSNVYFSGCCFMMAFDSHYWAIMILLGLFLKLGLFPFFSWVPKVYQFLEWGGCLMVSVWQKFAPLFIMVNNPLFLKYWWLVCFSGALSAWIGGLMGVTTNLVRVLMGWSSVSHAGWMVMLTLTDETTLLIYFGIYAAICTACYSMFELNGLMKFSSFGYYSQGVRVCLSLALLSMAGIPPLSGFTLKWVALLSIIDSGYYLVSLLLILGSAMSALLYVNLVFTLTVHSWAVSLSFPIETQVWELGDYIRMIAVVSLFPIYILFSA